MKKPKERCKEYENKNKDMWSHKFRGCKNRK